MYFFCGKRRDGFVDVFSSINRLEAASVYAMARFNGEHVKIGQGRAPDGIHSETELRRYISNQRGWESATMERGAAS
jgi:hypothetical protein